jgi:hypothetical protein
MNFCYVSPVSGNSGASGVAPMGATATDYGVGMDELFDTGFTAYPMTNSGETFIAPAALPYHFDNTKNTLFQVVYSTELTAANIYGSASGQVNFALTVYPLSLATLTELSGHTGVSPSSNGTDFAAQNWSGVAAASGLGIPLYSTWAEVSGYLSGSGGLGTNFQKGDILYCEVEKTQAGATSGCPIWVFGLNVLCQLTHV